MIKLKGKRFGKVYRLAEKDPGKKVLLIKEDGLIYNYYVQPRIGLFLVIIIFVSVIVMKK